MTTKIALATWTVQQVPNPQGVMLDGYMAWLTKANVTQEMQTVDADTHSVTFTITQAGTYTVHVVRMDTQGNTFGSSASSDPFVVTEDMVDVPLTVTVTLADPVSVPRNVKVRTR